jgi:cytidine deaminase
MNSSNGGVADAAWEALPVGRDALLDAARAAYARAYSPYSQVKVGAALLDREGRVFVGCNVENASHGLTVCAERNAVGRAVVEGAGELVAVAIASDRGDPLMPCGACRQVLTEFAPEMLVATVGVDGAVVLSRLDELLPLAFTPRDLER